MPFILLFQYLTWLCFNSLMYFSLFLLLVFSVLFKDFPLELLANAYADEKGNVPELSDEFIREISEGQYKDLATYKAAEGWKEFLNIVDGTVILDGLTYKIKDGEAALVWGPLCCDLETEEFFDPVQKVVIPEKVRYLSP